MERRSHWTATHTRLNSSVLVPESEKRRAEIEELMNATSLFHTEASSAPKTMMSPEQLQMGKDAKFKWIVGGR